MESSISKSTVKQILEIRNQSYSLALKARLDDPKVTQCCWDGLVETPMSTRFYQVFLAAQDQLHSKWDAGKRPAGTWALEGMPRTKGATGSFQKSNRGIGNVIDPNWIQLG